MTGKSGVIRDAIGRRHELLYMYMSYQYNLAFIIIIWNICYRLC
jgi:hypothetical protein